MKRWVCLWVALLAFRLLFAQVDEEPLFEVLEASGVEEEALPFVMEPWMAGSSRVDLNRADAERLQQQLLLSEMQVEALCRYR